MKVFVDSSVLVATYYGDHPHHEASIKLLSQFKKADIFCGVHSLAEVFAVLTGMPGEKKAAPHQALLFLEDIRSRLTLVSLDEEEYFERIRRSSEEGFVGASIYDALLGACALKIGAKAIFTWNLKDFQRIFPEKPNWVRRPDSL